MIARAGGAAPSILDRVLHHAETHPGRTLYSFVDAEGRPRASVTYEGFAQKTNDVAVHLHRDRVCGPGDRVILVYPPGIDMLVAFFACVRLGAIPVPVCPPASHGARASRDRLRYVARDCEATAVLSDRSCTWSARLDRARCRVGSLFGSRDRSDRLPWVITTDGVDGGGEEIRRSPSEILFLQYTSGSTREPRGVVVSHENVLRNGASVFDRPPIGVSWLPQYHDMGLIGSCLFVALAGGTTHLLSPLDFLRRPGAWLRAMTQHRATVSAAPNFAYAFCLRRDRLPDDELDGIDLGSLEILMNGAEPVRADVFRAFEARFRPFGLRPGVLGAAYGLAEYTLAVSNRGCRVGGFDTARLAENEAVPVSGSGTPGTTTQVVSCGRPLSGTEVRIVGLDGPPQELPPGRVGEIWVDGPGKCLGYWNRPELTRRTFQARLGAPGAGERTWLRTGDLGFVREGELFVCGRRKDLIIIRGLNYHPQDIEAVVEESGSVRNGCVAAFAVDTDGGEALAVVAELRGRNVPDGVADINRRLRRRLGLVASSFTWIRKRTIPKTSSGKIMRNETRRRLSQGELRVLAHVECAAETVPRAGERRGLDGGRSPGVGPWGSPEGLENTFHSRGLTGEEEGTLTDVGLDSLALADLAVEVERHLEAAHVEALDGIVDLRWLQRIPIRELVALLHQVVVSAPGARLRLRRAFADLREEQEDLERHRMIQDARVPAPAPDGGTSVRNDHGRRRGILLTGGTGFFGPFLLRSLLEQTDDPVYVLVRGGDLAQARARLAGALDALGPELSTGRTDGWEARVIPVLGDLEQPGLGLSSADWRRLAEETHVVYHNAAGVNYLKEYAALRAANVVGTREVLRLAASGRAKTVNHVSTTFVFGWSTTETLLETDTCRDLSLLDFGYSQSKWVSERIVLGAMGRGLAGRVFRPALIAPSLGGGGGSFDIAIRLLTFMLKHGIGTTAGNQVSFSPADLVADNVVAISNLDDTVGRTFHVTRDRRSTMQDITDLLGARVGREFTLHPLDEFVPEVVARCTREDPLFPLLNFLVRSVDRIASMEFKAYDNRNYREARARAPHAREDPPLEDVVTGILRFMDRHGLIDAPGPDPIDIPAPGLAATGV